MSLLFVNGKYTDYQRYQEIWAENKDRVDTMMLIEKTILEQHLKNRFQNETNSPVNLMRRTQESIVVVL
jgi:hypothetical protein